MPGKMISFPRTRIARPRAENVYVAALMPRYAHVLTDDDRGWWAGWTGAPAPAGATDAWLGGWIEGMADRAASDALPEPEHEDVPQLLATAC